MGVCEGFDCCMPACGTILDADVMLHPNPWPFAKVASFLNLGTGALTFSVITG